MRIASFANPTSTLIDVPVPTNTTETSTIDALTVPENTTEASTIDSPPTATMTVDQARALTDRIRRTTDQVWALLLEAMDRKAWEVLGYASMIDYVKAEFGMSRSYAYRLRHQGRLIHALQAAAPESPIGDLVSENVARHIKPHLVPMVIAEVRNRIENGADQTEAVQGVLAETRTRADAGASVEVEHTDIVKPVVSEVTKRISDYLKSHKRADRSNRYLAATVEQALMSTEGIETNVNFAALDRGCLPEWIEGLRQAEQDIARLRKRLEREVQS